MQWRSLRGSKNSLFQQGIGSTFDNVNTTSGVFSADSLFAYKNSSKWLRDSPQKIKTSQIWVFGKEGNKGSSGGYASYNTSGLTTTGTSNPVQLGSGNTWLYVAGSKKANFTVTSSNKLYTSGINHYGILGKINGASTTISSAGVYTAGQIGALTNWKYPAVGESHGACVKTDGTLWIWGSGNGGRLGLGNTTNYSSPKQVGALTNWYKVFIRKTSTFAIKTDGTLWSWGLNTYGQLGNGNTTGYSSPIQIGSLTNWAKIMPTSDGALALKTDGTLWAWGKTHVFGSSVQRSSPVQVSSDIWNDVSVTYQPIGIGTQYNKLSVAGIRTDGTLWIIDNGNSSGTTGSPGRNVYDWKQIGTDNNWAGVSIERISNTGDSFVAAVKTNGTLWTWGNGSNGVLGLGNTTSYSSPKQVGAVTTWQKAFHAGSLRTMALRS